MTTSCLINTNCKNVHMIYKQVASFFEKLANPYPESLQTYTPKSFVSFIWECCNGIKKHIFAVILCTTLRAIIEAGIFLSIGRIINELSVSDTHKITIFVYNELVFLLSLFLLLFLSIILLRLFKFQTIHGNLPALLRWQFHRIILDKNISFFQNHASGSIVNKVMQTPLAIRDAMMNFCDILIYTLIYFISSSIVLISFHQYLLLPFLMWLVLYNLTCIYFIPKLTQISKKAADKRSAIAGYLSDIYTNIYTVKAFKQNSYEKKQALQVMQNLTQSVYHQQRLVTAFDIVVHTIGIILIIATGIVAIYLWDIDDIKIGIIAAAVAMAMRLNNISQWIMWVVAELFDNIGTIHNGMEVVTSYNAAPSAPKQILEVGSGAISFRDISFSYLGNNKILDNFNLEVCAGEKVGIIGRSGAGKTTIINLLLRFYDVNCGQILVDEQNINHITIESLRNNIGIVTQDASLFYRSIHDNILYGKTDAHFLDIQAAAIKADADKFIRNIIDQRGCYGYDALIGERGVKLSGGQKQRIAIARIMLKNPPILLLDEATSALDSESEAAIQSNLYEIMHGKTVIAVAHRLSTLTAMDRLIVIDKGRIIESGTHQHLLNEKGVYYQLWQHQSNGFIGID